MRFKYMQTLVKPYFAFLDQSVEIMFMTEIYVFISKDKKQKVLVLP